MGNSAFTNGRAIRRRVGVMRLTELAASSFVAEEDGDSIGRRTAGFGSGQ